MRNDFVGESAYLAHHGILGQKWGTRNGPPYPLGAGDHSVSEKKAGYKKSIGGGRNEDLYDRHKQMKTMYDKASPGKFQLKPAKKPGSLSKGGSQSQQFLKDIKAKAYKSDADAFRYNQAKYRTYMEKVIAKRSERADRYAEKHNGKRSKFRDSLAKEAKDALEFEEYRLKRTEARASKAQKEADDYRENTKAKRLMDDRIKYIKKEYKDLPETRDAMIRDVQRQYTEATGKKPGITLTDGQKKALKIGAAVAVTALVAYGGYKLATNPKVQDAVKKGLSKVKGGSLNNTLKTPAAWVDDNIRLAKSQGVNLGKGWDTDFFKTPQGPKPSADQTLNNLYKHWDAKNAAEKSANRGLSEAQKIINNANKISGMDQIKKAATSIDSSDISRIKALRSSGKSVDEVAKMLGISPSSVSMYTDDAAKAAAKTTDEMIKKYASSPEHAKSLMKTRDRLKAMQDVDDYTQELLKKNAAKLKRIK